MKLKFTKVSKLMLGLFGLGLTLQLTGQEPMAAGKEKWLGNIYAGNQVTDFTEYWNQVTPENAGKWGSVEGTRDVFNWGALDNAYELAKENGFPFRFHVLLWGSQQPDWIEDLSEEEQLEEIIEWMDEVAERYPEIDYLEVVNEPLHQAPDGIGRGNYARALGGQGTTGWDWLIEGFRMARERFPNAQLVLNDYGIVGNASETSRYLKIINLLIEENLIDVIGVQAHAFSTRGTAESMKETLDALAETDLPIMATEMDIDGGTNLQLDDEEQLEGMQRIFPVFWEHRHVVGVTFWGWRSGLWRSEQGAQLLTNSGQDRPALEWLRQYVEKSSGSVDLLSVDDPMNFSIYPNPVRNNAFTLQASEAIGKIEVLDLSGKVINQIKPSLGSLAKISLESSLPKGIYLVKTEFYNGEESTKRIVID